MIEVFQIKKLLDETKDVSKINTLQVYSEVQKWSDILDGRLYAVPKHHMVIVKGGSNCLVISGNRRGESFKFEEIKDEKFFLIKQ